MFRCLPELGCNTGTNSLGTVLSETVAAVSLSAPPTVTHIRRWAVISHITLPTMLCISRHGYACWWLFACYVCEVLQYSICRWYYVTAERRWRSEWVGVQYRARLTRALLAGTDRIHSNSYTKTHRPTRRQPLDKQCRLAIIILTVVFCYLKDLEYTASRRQSAAMPSSTQK